LKGLCPVRQSISNLSGRVLQFKHSKMMYLTVAQDLAKSNVELPTIIPYFDNQVLGILL
jgi:hypothetical protein